MEKIRITPEISTLLPNQKFNCEFKNCKAFFSTISNLNMHVQRSHQSKKLEKQKDPNKYLFHCPVEGCKFHENFEENPKTFSNLKYLKNHYQNIHLARNIKCNKCEKDFITEGRLKAHLKICGVTFKCPICDIPYNSSIALYIHNKRKHPDSLKKDRRRGKKKVKEEHSTPAQHFVILELKHPSRNQETQTEEDETPSHTETQTDINSTSSILEDLLYSNTYTQTGPPGSDYLHMQTQTEDWSTSISSQTLNFDGFTTDIQTQTNWFSTQSINDFDGSNNIQTQTNWCGSPCSNSFNAIDNIDELLVSTETQTSFTQCLLDSCTGTEELGRENDFFGQGFTTVETQTDSFLDELLGNEEDDLNRL
ncbi:ATMIN family protein [Megaselia abdita]